LLTNANIVNIDHYYITWS